MPSNVAKWIAKLPIRVYRYTLSPLVGWHCRHLPTCSEYGVEAIDTHGAWRGGWLTISRLSRCNPWGSCGYDPVPGPGESRVPWWAPWRLGKWRGVSHDRR